MASFAREVETQRPFASLSAIQLEDALYRLTVLSQVTRQSAIDVGGPFQNQLHPPAGVNHTPAQLAIGCNVRRGTPSH